MKDKQILIDYKEYLELERKAELIKKILVDIRQVDDVYGIGRNAIARLNKQVLCEIIGKDVYEFYID